MKPTIAHYRLEGELGRGGMGVVYRAIDTRLGRAVAIKMLPAEATADADRNRRFIHEARAASSLNHPHIVTIHDIGEEDGATYVAMELVDGTPLDKLLARGPLSVAQGLEYGAQIAGALGAAHASGIVHRDVKPANIMITADGRAKVLDFGLAKLIERAPGDATITAMATVPGFVLGTLAYMSPEQAEGRPVDARSDVFSFGVVLYEMLAGQRPFAGSSEAGVITAILRDPAPPLPAKVPRALAAIVDRTLAKDRDARYANGAEVKKDLDAVHATMARPSQPLWRRTSVVAGALILVGALGTFAAWQTVHARRVRAARLEGIPQIERLMTTPKSIAAVRLAQKLEPYAPEEIAQLRRTWLPFRVVTNPAGASVEIKDYPDTGGPWEPLGSTPIDGLLLPFAYYRVRLTKPGYVPLEMARGNRSEPVRLEPEQTAPAGMVRVPGGPYQYGVSQTVTLPEFWIDRYEVTNREFKQFIDAGGYRVAKYWTTPFVDGGRTVSFTDAVARFRDMTGRMGPASWELGTYPDGHADYPVGGISWYEAAAYATYAGKSLPTLYHWYRAAGVDQIYSDILTLSNFDGKGPTRAGDRQGLGPFGTYDMAGNVKEWCVNLAADSATRYILGGGWNEPSYRFNEAEARNPWSREQTFGVRLIKNLGPADAAVEPIGRVNPDPKTVVPVADSEFEAYKRFYVYDRTPLDARVEATDDTSPLYRKETVSFAAAYGGQRVPAYLFLPKQVPPPYQTIVLFPSAYARGAQSSRYLDLDTFEYIIKSGRAVLYPVYQGTFERHNTVGTGNSAIRDMQVEWAKDFFRAVDYLETRQDVAMQRLGYFSLSMGAYFAPIPLALDPRVKAAVVIAAGLRYNFPPETQPANFMPHVKIPVLMINGRDDFSASQAAQERVFELLGTPPEHKRHVALDGGHVPNDRRGLMREVLDWYDKYLGAPK
jgi:eukaryotic-like serine/threonine-protein kinase